MGSDCPNGECHKTENIYFIFYNRFVCMISCDELLTTLAAIEDIFTQCDLKM